MDLRDYVTALRRHVVLAVVVALLVLATGAVPLVLAQPVYVARATVALDAGSGATPRDLADGVALARAQVPAVARLGRLPSVLEPAGAALDPPLSASEIGSLTEVEAQLDSPVVVVAVRAPDPVEAAERAGAVAGALVGAVGRVAPSGSAPGLAVRASVLSAAQPPRTPAGPHRSLTVLVTVLAAGLAALVVAAVADTPARRRRSVVVGVVPALAASGSPVPAGRLRDRPGRRRGSRRRRRGPATVSVDLGRLPAELAASGARTVSVCLLDGTARRRERDDHVLAPLVAGLRREGARVLVLDGGPGRRGPRRSRRDAVAGGDVGSLAALLTGAAPLAAAVRPASGPAVADTVGTRGAALPEDLDPVAVREVLGVAHEHYDVVLVRSPSPETSAGLTLAGVADAVLLVAGGTAARQELAGAAAALEVAGPRPRGLLLG